MTSPRHVPQFGTWSVPNCQLIVEYDLEVLETVRREVTAGFDSGGGREVAGLLLGNYSGERVQITGFEPIQCEHAFGPMFIPSPNDTARLTAQLLAYEDRTSSGGEIVVGWYASHVRRGLALAAEDIKIYDRHFPKPWQVALLLRPAPGGSVHARFFLRESGTPSQTAKPSPAATGRAQDARPAVRERRIPTAATPAPLADVPRRPENPGPAKPPSIRVPVENQEESAPGIHGNAKSRGIQSRAVWLVLAVVFVLAIASVFYVRFHFAVMAKSPGIVPIEAGIRDGGLEVRWDPKTLGVVKQGWLEVRNGVFVQHFPMDRETLIYGRFTCWPKSDVTNLRLHVERMDGAGLEGSTTYVARSIPVPVETVAQAAPPPTQPEPPAPANQLSQTPPAPVPVPMPPAPKEPPAKVPVEDRKPAAAAPIPAAAKQSPPAVSVSTPVKQSQPATATPSQPKQEEPPKPKPEIRTPEPVQTAQAQSQPLPELAAQVQSPTIQTLPRVSPQPAPPPPPPANRPQFRLEGHWVLQSGGYSRSPAVPEAVEITITGNDEGIRGNLEARYKSRSRPGRVHFSFSGKVTNGAARFGWTGSNGQPSQIEFIRIPNSPDVMEVVWQNPETKQLFDEMLRRSSP